MKRYELCLLIGKTSKMIKYKCIKMLNERTYEALTYVAFSAEARDQVDHNRCYRTNIHDPNSIKTECAMGRNKLSRWWVIATKPARAVSKSANGNNNNKQHRVSATSDSFIALYFYLFVFYAANSKLTVACTAPTINRHFR